MGDIFLKISGNPTARKIVKTLKLPVPLPQNLERVTGPLSAQPLSGAALVEGAPGGALLDAVRTMVESAGASLGASGGKVKYLVYDATGVAGPDGLKGMYEFFHGNLRSMAPCGRLLVLARPPEATEDAAARAARRAIEGFVRAAGREVGRRGATAQAVYVAEGAEDRVEPVVRFVLSRSSAYISGQALHVTARAAYTPGAPFVKALEGKVALVTGAARGIGAATAAALAREGAKVIVMDRPEDLAASQELAASIGGTALAADVTKPDAAEKIIEHVKAQCGGGLDIVVHNAGITRDKMLVNMKPEQWDAVLTVNLIGLIRTNEALLGTIRNGGRILAMSSVNGIAGNAGQTNYSATKAGVIGYMQGVAEKVAARGITANAVAPGFIETRMTGAMPFVMRQIGRRFCSLGQGGLPEDIAEAIVFLASPGAGGLTGEVLRICGLGFMGA